MPNLITHNYFSKAVKGKLSGDALKIVEQAPEAYYLGALGPDCLFALRELGTKYKYYPNRMQYYKVKEVFDKTADYFRKNEDGVKLAYMLGMLCHYVSDYHMHPYVNYFVENGLAKLLPPEQQTGIHTLIESAIDSHICDEILSIPCGSYPAGSVSKAPRRIRLSVGELYEKVINGIYGIYPSKKAVSLSFVLTKLFLDISVDKKGRKRKFFDWLERKIGGKKKVTALIRPPEGYRLIDYLNFAHSPWLTVRNGAAYSTMSADEVLETAAERAVAYIDNYIGCIYRGEPLSDEDFAVNYEGVRTLP